MSRILFRIKAVKDETRVEAIVWDDHLEWKAEMPSTAARTWLTPISTQLALSPLVAAARAAGSDALPFDAIASYTWYAENGQINLFLTDGHLAYFLIRPAKRAKEFMDVFHAAHFKESADRAARKTALEAQSEG